MFAGSDATEEDSKRYYMVTEAYRQWHNECPDNTPLEYFVLPFENFPGSVASKDIREVAQTASLCPKSKTCPLCLTYSALR